MVSRVLLLTPSKGLGGGIERYAETLEWAFSALGVKHHRIDLRCAGAAAHGRLLADSRDQLRASAEPTRLVLAHRSLLPVASLLAREPFACGLSVVCHGSDVWGTRPRIRQTMEDYLLRRPGVRAVAVSSFTAGVLSASCPACVLSPALSAEWFSMLVDASKVARPQSATPQLVTVFRLADWRAKGLPELLAAIADLGRPDIHLTVCGSGEPPPEMLRLIGGHPQCSLRTGLPDRELALQLAAADLFVLATRTKAGRRASGEGFGLVLAEAQVAGTPVIGPAYGGSRDAYIDGVTGVAPTDESPEALSRILGELLRNPGRLKVMGRRAACWGRESFAPEIYPYRVAERLL